MTLETPYFVIDEHSLAENTDRVINAMDANWPRAQLSYSVKTNSLPWILGYLHSKGVAAEVVSDEEYELALLCGYADNEIIFNGPCKGKERLLEAIARGARVNLDSKREIEWLVEAAPQHANAGTLGIRINMPPSLFHSEDIGYTDAGFRFGFSSESGELAVALDRLNAVCDVSHIGLHMHCNSITRSPEVYRSIARYAVEIANRYDLQPSFVDVGGGFFGGVPGKPSAEEYFGIIAEELRSSWRMNDCTLIAEPGSAIVGSVVDLHTSVIDVKDTELSRVITTDGSRVHIDPLWQKSSYRYTLDSESKEVFPGKQLICGYTCMDHDRIMELESEREIRTGDTIVYHMVGAYSVTFGGPFIKYWPDVYVSSNGRMERIRTRISVEEYLAIQS